MPAIYEHTFKIRHYECDPYGHVNHANYLRFMQEASFEASAAVGYSVERYEAMGLAWIIRETDITYLLPLHYGDSVTVKTWVADARRIRSLRMHELRHAGNDQPVARAQTEWVLVDRATLRPVRITAEMIAAYMPEGAPQRPIRRDSFASAPPPPPGLFSVRRRVQWRDIDPMGHVNNATYVAYLEDIGVDVCQAHGWPMTRMLADGFGIVARRYRIQYLQQAVLGDEVEIATWASSARRATATRHYIITRLSDGLLLAQANVYWVWIDLESGRPIRIPDGFLADFAPNFTGQSVAGGDGHHRE